MILEVFYRNQWVDTYSGELKALNPDPAPSHPRKKVLALGDSFTAATNNWVDLLRKRHPDWHFLNSALPGTTVYHANLVLGRRLADFKPDWVVYQVYVGNDLFDLRYPGAWGRVGIFRSLYWSVANRFRSLAWLNYALGKFKRSAALPDMVPEKSNEGAFDPKKYSPRDKLYLEAEPRLIVGQVRPEDGRWHDMHDYMEILDELVLRSQAAGAKVMIVVVPHCAQVSEVYADRMADIGAEGMENPVIQELDYPFFSWVKEMEVKGAKVVNLLPALRELELRGHPAYYLHDTHLSDSGQAVLARVVEEVLVGD
ncbi:MAG: SGNH/GDSL hydrolase family protein [Bacteroidia bacterium]